MAQPTIEGTGLELISVLHHKPNDRFRLIKLTSDADFATFEEALAKATSRTANEVAADRARLIQASPTSRDLPTGCTLEDVVMGKWPGNESDEQIFEALEKLS
jgi:hypothetical protein